MLALCSQDNPPTPFSILFNSEGPKNPDRIPWPEVSVTASGLMPCSRWRGFEPVSRNFKPRIGPITPSRRAGIWREERGGPRRLHGWGRGKPVPGPKKPIVLVTRGHWYLLWLPWVQEGKKKKLAARKCQCAIGWTKTKEKPVEWTAYLLSVSVFSSPLKPLIALIKHKQKSLP